VESREFEECNRVGLAVAIVSYNARDELEACLTSVFASSGVPGLEVVVVDNASTDGSAAMVQERFPAVIVVASDDNLGFARACNLAWRLAENNLVVFLNSDTVVPVDALAKLGAMLSDDANIAVVGPLLRNADGSVQMSFGRTMSLSAEFRQKLLDAGYRNGHGPLRRYVERLHAHQSDVDWVSGACLVTRREVLEAIGGFDEAFFLYSEDVDLCARVRARGGRVVFTPDVEIVHHRGGSTSKEPDTVYVASQRSRLHFYKKHYGQPRLGLLKMYMTTKLALAYVLRPSARRAYRSVLELVFHGDNV
jgi:N-acetylglucosaminyl-diphospho-decaprenol L-rhamnosyltransferase